jgi:hypothetical protein
VSINGSLSIQKLIHNKLTVLVSEFSDKFLIDRVEAKLEIVALDKFFSDRILDVVFNQKLLLSFLIFVVQHLKSD